MKSSRFWTLVLAGVIALGAGDVLAGQGAAGGWLELGLDDPAPMLAEGVAPAGEADPYDKPPTPDAAEVEPREWQKPIPVSFFVDYTLVSDYIFRGVNFSEYEGEGGERCNQQMTVGGEVDLGEFGAIGANAWFEWYSGNTVDAFDDTTDDTLQEVDYSVYYAVDVFDTGVSVETGWIWYVFPELSGDAYCTNEWYVSIAYDDSALFGTDAPLLNPYVALFVDNDDVDGCWIEMGVSHDFVMAEYGMSEVPVVKDITLTPSWLMGIDHNQVDEGCHLHNIEYGLDVTYDLSSAVGLPAQYGTMAVTGFLRFSDAINDTVINDEFYGGVTVGYAW